MATAYAALLSLMHNIYLIRNHPRHSFSFENEQILSLREPTLHLINFMRAHDSCHCGRKEAAEALEKRIARAAHAAEDVIESHVVDQIRAGSTLHGERASRFLLDLQKVIQDMDFVWRKAQRGLKVERPTHSAPPTPSTPLTSQMNCNRVVGFDGVLFHLMDLLTGGNPSRRVIPIAGMAGIGKTTLATKTFQDSYIVHYFDVCLWTTISQQYSVHRILSELVSCLGKSSRRTVDELGEVLYKSLLGQRYLIVLDDMWSVQVWDEMKFFFPDIGNGSRIVVTSRHSHVARHLSSSYLEMSFLDEDNSWELFCLKAFAEQDCPPELEEIGRKIVEKCKGLPLAIVVVGGYLRKSSQTLQYWVNVSSHMNSILNSAENERCLNILSMSYNYLPIFLKPCFMFMGVFPEDEKIPVSDILQLWIAEGFIQPCGCHCLEYTAWKYLIDLIERNLILVYRTRFDGEIVACRIHDLVRELCLKIGKEKDFIAVLDTPSAINKEVKPSTRNRSGPTVRSLICEGGRMPMEMKLLRVVNKVDRALANEVNLQHLNLRYLNVALDYKSYRPLYLPSSISLLWNLQTLKIGGHYLAIIAPYEIWEMLELRHIEVDTICLLDPLPVEHADDLVLRFLNVLLKVENLSLSEEACRRIPNLVELEVSYCHLEMDCDEARSYYCPHNLACFRNLHSLVCQFDHDPKWRDFALSLTFPSLLHSLTLTGSRLDWEALTTMVGSLHHLQHLVLKSNAVIGPEWNPAEGGFPRLKSMDIHGCDDLVYWNADKSHFPALRYLHLSYLSKLDQLPSSIGETIRGIGVEFCSISSTISAMRMLVEQEELGNTGFHLHVCVRGDDQALESFNEKVEEEGLTSQNLSKTSTPKYRPALYFLFYASIYRSASYIYLRTLIMQMILIF